MFGITNENQNAQSSGQLPPYVHPPEPVAINNPITAHYQPAVDVNSAQSAAQVQEKSAVESQHNELLQLKQKALESLAPMVNKLDQSPEEKFKTIMMLIQASDNPSLVNEAYEAAKQIADERQRAQALIDVVNEINYFTHSKQP